MWPLLILAALGIIGGAVMIIQVWQMAHDPRLMRAFENGRTYQRGKRKGYQ